MQEGRGEGGPGDEQQPERAEGQSRAPLELLVHAGAARPDELAFDQVLVGHHSRSVRIVAAVFPSIQGRRSAFFYPKG